jgi:hypothetical protein
MCISTARLRRATVSSVLVAQRSTKGEYGKKGKKKRDIAEVVLHSEANPTELRVNPRVWLTETLRLPAERLVNYLQLVIVWKELEKWLLR